MNKKIALMSTVLGVLILSSCTIQIVDRPDYYKDYDDTTAAGGQVSSNYYYSSHYVSAGAVPTVMPTAAPAAAVTVNFITLKVAGNTYYFYEGDVETAVWIFKEDGTIQKSGKKINGLVKRFYNGTYITESEIMYKNGERWGACKKFYPNGLLKELVNFSNGGRHGAYKIYYPNGRIMEEGSYKNGKMNGNFKRYLETGETIEHGTYGSKGYKVLYMKPTPAAVPSPAERDGFYRDNKYGVKVVVTMVVTATPVVHGAAAIQTQVAINIAQKKATQAPVVITVVVTATPQPMQEQAIAATQVMAVPEEKNNNGNHKPDWVQEKNEIKEAVKEESKEIKQEMKEAIKEEGEDRKQEMTEYKEELKDGVKRLIKENKEDAAGNTAGSQKVWRGKGKAGKQALKKDAALDADAKDNTDEAKIDDGDNAGEEGKEKSLKRMKDKERENNGGQER